MLRDQDGLREPFAEPFKKAANYVKTYEKSAELVEAIRLALAGSLMPNGL